MLRKGEFEPAFKDRIEAADDYFKLISDGWGDALKMAFSSLPPFELDAS